MYRISNTKLSDNISFDIKCSAVSIISNEAYHAACQLMEKNNLLVVGY